MLDRHVPILQRGCPARCGVHGLVRRDHIGDVSVRDVAIDPCEVVTGRIETGPLARQTAVQVREHELAEPCAECLARAKAANERLPCGDPGVGEEAEDEVIAIERAHHLLEETPCDPLATMIGKHAQSDLTEALVRVARERDERSGRDDVAGAQASQPLDELHHVRPRAEPVDHDLGVRNRILRDRSMT